MATSDVQVKLRETGGEVVVNGEDLSSRLRSVEITAGVGDLTMVTVTYACATVLLDGKAKVIHACGEGDAYMAPFHDTDAD